MYAKKRIMKKVNIESFYSQNAILFGKHYKNK